MLKWHRSEVSMGKRGAPQKQYDPKIAGTVRALRTFGVPIPTICRTIQQNELGKISQNTLRKLYAKELEEGEALGDSKLYETAFSIATKQKNVTMLIFLMKTRLGLKETERHEVTGEDGGPVQHEIRMTFVEPRGNDGGN